MQHGSSNWLKVQKHTPDKPQLRQLARMCDCSLGDAFLAWFRVYAYLDEVTADGSVLFMAPADVDDVARLPGTGDALAAVQWLLFDSHGCTVVQWDRHNGRSAKKRALDAERQARFRQNQQATAAGASRAERDNGHGVGETEM